MQEIFYFFLERFPLSFSQSFSLKGAAKVRTLGTLANIICNIYPKTLDLRIKYILKLLMLLGFQRLFGLSS
jgi:hypothetical protein